MRCGNPNGFTPVDSRFASYKHAPKTQAKLPTGFMPVVHGFENYTELSNPRATGMKPVGSCV